MLGAGVGCGHAGGHGDVKGRGLGGVSGDGDAVLTAQAASLTLPSAVEKVRMTSAPDRSGRWSRRVRLAVIDGFCRSLSAKMEKSSLALGTGVGPGLATLMRR